MDNLNFQLNCHVASTLVVISRVLLAQKYQFTRPEGKNKKGF